MEKFTVRQMTPNTTHESYRLKIWFDVTTPKELLFFESIMERISINHDVLFTTGSSPMVAELCSIRNLCPTQVGEFGGTDRSQRLTIQVDRAAALSSLAQKFKPDVVISSCSIEASRVSFGLGIPHMGFSNTPYNESICRRSIPLITKLFTPSYIPVTEFTRYGITADNIVQYSTLDECLIIRNRPTSLWSAKSLNLQPNKKTIVLNIHNNSIIDIINEFPQYNIVVLTQDANQIKLLQSFDNIIILNQAFDSQQLFSRCDVMVGHNGAMIAEAALRGIPTILHDTPPTINERHLMELGILMHTDNIIKSIKHTMSSDRRMIQKKAHQILCAMQDPYDILMDNIRTILD